MKPTLRVVQWTTGKTGGGLRCMARHLSSSSSVVTHSTEKVGQDAGELAASNRSASSPPTTSTRSSGLGTRLRRVYAVPALTSTTSFASSSPGINVVTTMYNLAAEPATATTCTADRSRRGTWRCLVVREWHLSRPRPEHGGPGVDAMCTHVERITLLESVDMRGYANEQMYRGMGIDRDLERSRSSGPDRAGVPLVPATRSR